MTKETVHCPDCDNDTFRIHREETTVDVRDLGPIEYLRIWTQCTKCSFKFVTPEQARDHDRQVKAYITTYVINEVNVYNSKYGDNRICKCGHMYYRHFDTYAQMDNIGCKYCPCSTFEEHTCDMRPQSIGAGEPMQPHFCWLCGKEEYLG